MRLLYGTGNPAKLDSMRRRLSALSMELIGLKDLNLHVPEVEETGRTPLENAELKATAYYRAFKIPVFSCDSGLYFEDVPDEVQPGVHVRTIDGKYLTDAEMIRYYTGLVARFGSPGPKAAEVISQSETMDPERKVLTCRYRNAICLVLDENHIFRAMDDSLASEPFWITDRPHPTIACVPGFPLDSISLDIPTGRYYYDLKKERLDKVAVEDGFLAFFRRTLGNP